MTSGPTRLTDSRLDWLDSAKGVAISLVVFGHALRGIERAGVIDFHGVWGRIDRVIYSFHMPMFFLISGFVFWSALARPAGAFLRSRVTRLLWPLALWTWIFFAARMLAGSAANTSLADSGGFPVFPLPPREHFWFLWGLFLVSVTVYALGRVLPVQRREVWLGVLIADLIWLGLAPGAVGRALWFPDFSFFLGFFLLGLSLRCSPLPAISRGGTIAAAVIFVAGCALAAVAPRTPLGGFALGAVLCLALCSVLRGLDDGGAVARWLQSLGRASMAIYLTHTILGAPIRIALMKVGVTQVGALLVTVTLVGLLVPPALDRLARRSGVARYLGW